MILWAVLVEAANQFVKKAKASQVTHLLAQGAIRVDFQSSAPGANPPALAGGCLVRVLRSTFQRFSVHIFERKFCLSMITQILSNGHEAARHHPKNKRLSRIFHVKALGVRNVGIAQVHSC